MSGSAERRHPWARRDEGIILTIRLTPKGGRDVVEGVEQLADGRSVLKVRVRAVPEAGAANAALMRVLADALDLPGRAIRLESGATARVKTLFLQGDPGTLESRLAALCRPR